MIIKVLGSGASLGVPMLQCSCVTCTSLDPKDKRTRSSVLVTVCDKNILIDIGPDFRAQALQHKISSIDTLLITHEHSDHTAGLDDIRPFYFFSKKSIPLYANVRTIQMIQKKFHYFFNKTDSSGCMTLHPIDLDYQKIKLYEDIIMTPIYVQHDQLSILGFRIQDFTYITDASKIDFLEIEKIKGSQVLMLNAIGKNQHRAHFSLQEAISLAQYINAPKTYITHMSHWMEPYAKVSSILSSNIFLAYDGLTISLV